MRTGNVKTWRSKWRGLWLLTAILLAIPQGWSDIRAAAAEAGAKPSVTIDRMAAADGESFALDNEGHLWAWGAYDDFLFGGLASPNAIDFFQGKQIVDLQAGYQYINVLLADGTVWMHTRNPFTDDLFEQVPGLTGIASIAAAPYFAYAVGKDGTVWTWNAESPSSPSFEKPRSRKDLPDVAQLAGSYAVMKDGTVWYLGLGAHEEAVRVEGLEDVRKIALGNVDQTGYALKNDGTVWTWGSSDLDGVTLSALSGRKFFEPAAVTTLTKVKDIAGGYRHFAALKQDGTVWTWGRNDLGQLGTGTKNDAANPTLVPTIKNAVSIYLGYQVDVTFAVLQDGTVWGWGRNGDRETGTGTEESEVRVPKRILFAPIAETGEERFNFDFQGKVGNDVVAYASNNSGTVLAATENQLLKSTDHGKSWSKLPLPAKADFHSLRHAKGVFYFWTYNTDEPKAYWSKDGRTWTAFRLAGPEGDLIVRNVTYMRNEYVLLASYDADDRTYVYTSPDGKNWTSKSTIPSDNVYDVVWNGKLYTAIGGGYRYYGATKLRNQFKIDSDSNESAELIVYTTADLKAWTMQSGSVKDDLSYTFSVNGVPSKNYYVGVQEVSTNGTIVLYDTWGNILKSTNGISFTLSSGNSAMQNLYGRGEMFSNGKQYLIYASLWRDEGTVLVSTDKVNWKRRTIPNIPLALQVTKSGSRFVGFGPGGLIATSGDGLNWSVARKEYPAQHLNDVIKANNRYVAVGSEFAYSAPTILVSKDGRTWTKAYASDRYATGMRDDVQSIVWSGTKFVAVGGKYAYTSATGDAWKKHALSAEVNLHDVVWTGKRFVALAEKQATYTSERQSILYSSADGVQWNAFYKTAAYITDLESHGGALVAVGSKGGQALVLRSTDLANWNARYFTLGQDQTNWDAMDSASFDYDGVSTFTNVQWVKDQYVIASDYVYTSKDGLNWTKAKGDYEQFISKTPAAHSSGRIIWTGTDYRYYKNHILGISKDLKKWDFYEADALYSQKRQIWTGKDLMGVGEDGLIVRIEG